MTNWNGCSWSDQPRPPSWRSSSSLHGSPAKGAIIHTKWTALLLSMTTGRGSGSGVSASMIGKVLERAALAPEPASRSEISKGTMLENPDDLAAGAVGKAVDALLEQGLLQEETRVGNGRPGPPRMPLRVGSPRWIMAGIHLDQQHEGPDRLTGILCGLDRQPIGSPMSLEILREDGKHSLRGLVQGGRVLIEELLERAAELAGHDPKQELLGVGVELGGHLFRGQLIDSTHAQWSQSVDLSAALAEGFSEAPDLVDVPIIVENDINALAIHGYYEGTLTGSNAVLIVVLRKGVGGALILDGRNYRGIHGMAPEPGHITVEYPTISDRDRPPMRAGADQGLAFDDECACSTKDHMTYGHVDTLATPSRIEGQLANLKPDKRSISLEQAAAMRRAVPVGDQLVICEEAKVLDRAGRALGRVLAHIVNIVNPGQLVLLLPEALATPAPQSSGSEYLEAAERELDGAYSTGPADARGGGIRLTVHGYAEDTLACDGAVAAATAAFNAFIEHARELDGCPLSVDIGRTRRQPRPLSSSAPRNSR